MASASSPEVVLLFKLRDEMSSQLAVVNARLDQTEQSANRTGRAFSRNSDSLASYSRNLLIFGATALTVASSVARLAGQFGFLNAQQEQQLTTVISTIGALSALAGALGRLIPIVIALARSQRTLAAAQAIVQAFSGPAGWVILAASIAAGVAAVAAINSMSSHQMGVGQSYQVPGPTTQGVLAMVHGGETVSRGGGSGGGDAGITVNLTGNFMGNEAEARGFARQIARILREENRTRGIT